MKQLKPIIVKPEYYESIEKTLNDFWSDVFYAPILKIIRENVGFVLNINSFISDALLSGNIQYNNGNFSDSQRKRNFAFAGYSNCSGFR